MTLLVSTLSYITIVGGLLGAGTYFLVSKTTEYREWALSFSSEIRVRPAELLAYVVMLGCFLAYLFYGVNYRHHDEVGLLWGGIGPMVWSGRFFPLGHQEFNILNLNVTGGSFVVLYCVIVLQMLLAVLMLMDALRLQDCKARILFVFCIFITAIWLPFENLVVPERNAMFFMIASFWGYMRFLRGSNVYFAVVAVCAAHISMYYKEPIFAFYLVFAGVHMITKFISVAELKWSALRRVVLGSPVELGWCLASVGFFAAYVYWVVLGPALTDVYLFSPSNFYMNLMFFVKDVSAIPLFFVLVINFVMLRNTGVEGRIAISCVAAAFVYFLEINIIGLVPRYYFHSIPYLYIGIAFVMLTREVWSAGSKKQILVLGAAYAVVVLCIPQAARSNYFFSISQKSNQLSYSYIEGVVNEIVDGVDSDVNVFYLHKETPYGQYKTAVMRQFLLKQLNDRKGFRINLYSLTGCMDHDRNQDSDVVHCFKYDQDIDFDIVALDGITPESVTAINIEDYKVFDEYHFEVEGANIDRDMFYFMSPVSR